MNPARLTTQRWSSALIRGGFALVLVLQLWDWKSTSPHSLRIASGPLADKDFTKLLEMTELRRWVFPLEAPNA